MINKTLSWNEAKKIGFTPRNFRVLRNLVISAYPDCLQSQSGFLVDYGETLINKGQKELGEMTIALGLSMYSTINVG